MHEFCTLLLKFIWYGTLWPSFNVFCKNTPDLKRNFCTFSNFVGSEKKKIMITYQSDSLGYHQSYQQNKQMQLRQLKVNCGWALFL